MLDFPHQNIFHFKCNIEIDLDFTCVFVYTCEKRVTALQISLGSREPLTIKGTLCSGYKAETNHQRGHVREESVVKIRML